MDLNICTLVNLRYHVFCTCPPYPQKLFPWTQHSSVVHNICARTWCTHSNIAFACGLLTVVGLCLIPYDSNRYSNFSLNSLPLLYLLNQIFLTNRAMQLELLLRISSMIDHFLPLTWFLIGGLKVIPQFWTNWLRGRSLWEPWSLWLFHPCI